METLPCGHIAHSSGRRACIHLLDESHQLDQVRRLTGTGVEFDTYCTECDEVARPYLVEICQGCHDRVIGDALGAAVPWRGEPELRERPEPTDRRVTDVPCGPAIDLAPVPGGWLVLHTDGALARLDSESGSWTTVATCTVPGEPDRAAWGERPLRRRLHAARGGQAAAVVNDHGAHGQVLDLATGAVTMTLCADDYHCDTVAFSLAFAEHAGRPVVVHRSAWNRLDAADALTGASLTDRGPTSVPRGEEKPPHYLDYFHGRLLLSPGGRWLADDGWVRHPVGAPTVWDARRWLAGNVWESEDGPSHRVLAAREYHWGSPMCWIDEDRLAVWGIGDDDEAMLDGVRIFDPATGQEVLAFAGPRGALLSDGVRLYAAAPEGLEIWDPVTGERTGTVPGFLPTAHHRDRAELAAITDGALRIWPTPTAR